MVHEAEKTVYGASSEKVRIVSSIKGELTWQEEHQLAIVRITFTTQYNPRSYPNDWIFIFEFCKNFHIKLA